MGQMREFFRWDFRIYPFTCLGGPNVRSVLTVCPQRRKSPGCRTSSPRCSSRPAWSPPHPAREFAPCAATSWSVHWASATAEQCGPWETRENWGPGRWAASTWTPRDLWQHSGGGNTGADLWLLPLERQLVTQSSLDWAWPAWNTWDLALIRDLLLRTRLVDLSPLCTQTRRSHQVQPFHPSH